MNPSASINILDVTLRDGGHVNNFAFGQRRIRTIVECLCRAHIDIIELGFLTNVTYNPDKSLFLTWHRPRPCLMVCRWSRTTH